MHALYHKAVEADEAFSAALMAQFGSSYRWKHTHKEYNKVTWDAYTAKVNADAAWLNHMRERAA